VKKLWHFIRQDLGSNAVEYSVILAVISLAIVVAATVIGGSLSNVFGRASSAFP
jgi:Flp pilus assembly pilin Flp